MQFDRKSEYVSPKKERTAGRGGSVLCAQRAVKHSTFSIQSGALPGGSCHPLTGQSIGFECIKTAASQRKRTWDIVPLVMWAFLPNTKIGKISDLQWSLGNNYSPIQLRCIFANKL